MQITNEKLYELCKKYGAAARFWRQRFIGLLPEVNRRKLHKEKGFDSIFEFAFKLCGLSEKQVCRVLNLEKRFKDKPDLHNALVNGEVSVNKLARVASIATAENQKALAEQVKILSQKAVEVFVQDEKSVRAHTLIDKHGLLGGEFESRSDEEPVLSDEVKAQLFELQRKGIDINEIILEALEKRKQDIEDEKRELSKEQIEKAERGAKIGRTASVKIKNILYKEYGTKCAVPNCTREADNIHHELPFAIVKNHNPFSMKPLCEGHHELMHSVDLKYQRMKERAKTRAV